MKNEKLEIYFCFYVLPSESNLFKVLALHWWSGALRSPKKRWQIRTETCIIRRNWLTLRQEDEETSMKSKTLWQAEMPVRLAGLALAVTPAAAWSRQQPNIILFMVDDMGWQDTSVPFWSHRKAWLPPVKSLKSILLAPLCIQMVL